MDGRTGNKRDSKKTNIAMGCKEIVESQDDLDPERIQHIEEDAFLPRVRMHAPWPLGWDQCVVYVLYCVSVSRQFKEKF